MSARKAKRPAKKVATSSAPEIALKLTPAQLERLHKAHDDLQKGTCLLDCIARSLEAQEIAFAEGESLCLVRQLIWPASEWMGDRRMDLPADADENDE